MTVTVNTQNMSIWDVLITHYGTLEALPMLLSDNPRLMPENYDCTAPETLQIRVKKADMIQSNNEVVDYMRKNNYEVRTLR